MFEPVKQVILQEKVLQQFIDLIRNNALKPGDKLPGERELCIQMQISRPVLREAMSTLRYLGYLESVHGSGTYVNKNLLDPTITALKLYLYCETAQILDIWEARYIIETQSAGLAAERATEDDCANIARALAYYQECAENMGNPEALVLSSSEFHNSIMEAAHNNTLVFLIKNVSNLLKRSREHTVQVDSSTERALEFHRRIAEAVLAHDIEKAKSAMSEHLIDVRNDLEAYVEIAEKK